MTDIKIIDKEIMSTLWQPVFRGGDRRVLDLIIAYREGWRNIHWLNNNWYGNNPDCEFDCVERVPFVHISEGKLIALIKRDLAPRVICLHEAGVVSVDGMFYRHATHLDNLLWIYMENLEERYG